MSRRALLLAVACSLTAFACSGSETPRGDSDGVDAPAKDRRTTPRATAGSNVCYEAQAKSAQDELTWRDRTDDLGLTSPLAGMLGHATAVGDVNRDGWTDLFVGNFADRPLSEYRTAGTDVPPPDRLLLGGPDGFRNDGSFPGELGRTSGAAFADLDSDTDLDLVIARNRRDVPRGRSSSVVLRNEGSGEFVLATEISDPASARSVGVLDADGDGLLDLLLVSDRFGGASTTRLLRNEGGFAFEDVTEEAGLPQPLHGFGVATVDLTQDGRPDIFVGGSNRLFVNDGSGRFRDADVELGWETFGPEDDPAGVATGDVDGDGLPDLVVGQHYNSTVDDGRLVPVRLYLNEGPDQVGVPRLRDVTEEAGLVGLPTKAPHVEIVDLDADGRADILTSASAGEGTVPAVFQNVGLDDEGIPMFTTPEGLGNSTYWVAGAVFDADHDGRLDVFLVDFDPRRGSGLLAYEGPSANWLGVQVGPAGSRGVGTSVTILAAAGDSDEARPLGTHLITASTGFGSGSLAAARFGVGIVSAVDVVVRRHGHEPIVLREIPVNRHLEVAGGRTCSPGG